MEIVYRRRRATVAEVRSDLTHPPTYSAVRGMLGYLEEKGYLQHYEEGQRYVYRPTKRAEEIRQPMLRHVVRTFFDNSIEAAMLAMLGIAGERLPPEQAERFAQLIERVRSSGEGDE